MKRKLSYLTILWVGVALWLGSIIIQIVLSLCGYETASQDGLTEVLENLKKIVPIVVILVLFGILIPILEEFMFRYWIKSKKRVMTIVLFAVMSATVAFSSFWWLGVAGFLLCLLLDLFLRNRPNARTISLMLATSLLFASAHIKEFSQFNVSTVFSLTDLFGMALVACWLIYNWGFWWACLLHVLNNTVALLLILLAPASSSVLIESRLDTHQYSAVLTPISGDTIAVRQLNDSTVVVMGELPSIALYLVEEFHPDIIHHTYSPTEFFRLGDDFKKGSRWKYTLTFHDSIPYGHAPQLVTDFADLADIHIDTTYKNVYILGIEDSSKAGVTTETTCRNFAELAEDIRISYDCPVVLEEGIDALSPISYEWDLFTYPYETERLTPVLSEKLGLYLRKSDTRKIPVITFSYGAMRK